MNIWLAKLVKLLVHSFPIGLPTRRQLGALILDLLYLPSQCSYKSGSIFSHSPNAFFQG